MKFSKFINKKMIIFVVLFSAFLYFSGSFNVMREGQINNYTPPPPPPPPPGTLIFKGLRCDRCLSTNQLSGCPDECKKFISDNNITSSRYEAIISGPSLRDTYFTLLSKSFKGNCTGCQLNPNPTNLPCDTGSFTCKNRPPGSTVNDIANAKDYNCTYNPQKNRTTCYIK